MVGVPEPRKGEVCAPDTGSGRLLTRIPVAQGAHVSPSRPLSLDHTGVLR